MHYVYDALSFLEFQIESLTAYDDILLVGTRQGHLLIYSVNTCKLDQQPDIQLMRYNYSFSQKPIQQLDVVPEYKILICLSDDIISIHDMSIFDFPILSRVQRTKGATLFTVDVKRQVSLTGVKSVMVRMCVLVKRQLRLFYWEKGEFLELEADVIVEDVPYVIPWCQEKLCIGFMGKNMLLKASDILVKLLVTGKHLEPSIIKLSDDIFVVGKDLTSVFMNTADDPVLNDVRKWSEVPIDLACDEPYLLTLLSKSVKVCTYEPLLHTQDLRLNGARIICHCRHGLVYVASTEHVWILLSDSDTCQNLSDDTKEEKANIIHQKQMLSAFDLFHRKRFHDSGKEFLKLQTDKEMKVEMADESKEEESKILAWFWSTSPLTRHRGSQQHITLQYKAKFKGEKVSANKKGVAEEENWTEKGDEGKKKKPKTKCKKGKKVSVKKKGVAEEENWMEKGDENEEKNSKSPFWTISPFTYHHSQLHVTLLSPLPPQERRNVDKKRTTFVAVEPYTKNPFDSL